MTIPTYQFHSPHNDHFEIANIEDKAVLHRLSQTPRRDHFYVIFLLESGRGIYHIDFQQYQIKANSVFCIAPHQVHYWQMEQAITGKVILFTSEFLTSNAAYPSLRFPQQFTIFNWETPAGFVIPEPLAEHFSTQINILLEAYHQDESLLRELAIQSALLLLLISIQGIVDEDAQRDLQAGTQLTQQFLAQVNAHYIHTNQVSDYANMLGVTSGHLADTVADIMGKHP